MNRSAFLKTLGLGLVSAPIALAKTEKPAPASAMKFVCEIPPEAGKIVSMTHYDERVWVACENGLYFFPCQKCPT